MRAIDTYLAAIDDSGENATLALPDGCIGLMKPAPGAWTLAAPVEDGNSIQLVNGSGHAHTVSAGGSILQFTNKVGELATLWALNGTWRIGATDRSVSVA